MNRHRLLPVSILVAAVLVGDATRAATGPYGTPPRVIPYAGTLDQSGMPVTGDVPMTFFLVTSATANSSQAIWTEDYPAGDPVRVLGGRFSVALGSKTPNTGIPDAVLRNGELYVGVKVAGVELTGKQRLFASPFAITAAQAQDLTVSGTATLNGPTVVNGAFTANSNNDVIIKKTMIAQSHVGYPSQGNDLAEIDNDSNVYKELMLVGNRSSGTRTVGVWDKLVVHGSLEVTCPTGMTSVGGMFCMDTGQRTETVYGDSVQTCANNNAMVCSHAELCTAIIKGVIPNASHRVRDILYYNSNAYLGGVGGVNAVVSTPGCTAMTVGPQAGVSPFRCCRPK